MYLNTWERQKIPTFWYLCSRQHHSRKSNVIGTNRFKSTIFEKVVARLAKTVRKFVSSLLILRNCFAFWISNAYQFWMEISSPTVCKRNNCHSWGLYCTYAVFSSYQNLSYIGNFTTCYRVLGLVFVDWELLDHFQLHCDINCRQTKQKFSRISRQRAKQSRWVRFD